MSKEAALIGALIMSMIVVVFFATTISLEMERKYPHTEQTK